MLVSSTVVGTVDFPWQDGLIARHHAVQSAVLNSDCQRAAVAKERCNEVTVLKLPGFGAVATYLEDRLEPLTNRPISGIKSYARCLYHWSRHEGYQPILRTARG